MTLSNIKDESPNPRVIELLKELLKEAEEGKIRSIIAILGYSDNTASRAWTIDDRTSHEVLSHQLNVANIDYNVSTLIQDPSSGLRRNLDDVLE